MANENLYHLLGFIPATEAWEMPPGLERAAQQLVHSGKLRVNADAERNFVRYGLNDWDATFTARELGEPSLLARTRAKLARHVPGALGEAGVDAVIDTLRRDMVKARGVAPEKEMRVARIVVQSAHPAVIQLLLESDTEVFVSYSHNVGDLIAVHEWQQHGNTGGMQATLERGTQVFISCAGDPFFEGEKKTYVTDGWHALARMVVIGAQELGHFADLIRNNGHIIGRYSLTPESRAARRSDIQRVATLSRLSQQAGLERLKRFESRLAFYDKRLKFTPPWFYFQWRRFLAGKGLKAGLRRHGISLNLHTFPTKRQGEALALFLADMAFNLTPQAEAYRHPDPEIEEQIACIEAMARVPQQVMKWGHAAVALAWPALYPLYYGVVTSGCRAALRHPLPDNNLSIFQQLGVSWRRRFRRRPGYYPEHG